MNKPAPLDTSRLIPADAATLEQLSAELEHVSLRRLRTMRTNREIDSWKVCNRVLMSRADVLAHVSEDYSPALQLVA